MPPAGASGAAISSDKANRENLASYFDDGGKCECASGTPGPQAEKKAAAPTQAVMAANANSFLFCWGPASAAASSAVSRTREADAAAAAVRGLAARSLAPSNCPALTVRLAKKAMVIPTTKKA